MPVILVIIIMVAWVVILGPNLLKRRSRTVGGINSISHFHRQLRVLEHSGPQPLVTPAYRLRAVDGAKPLGSPDAGGDVRVIPKLAVVGADQLPRPALAFLGEPVEGSASVGTDMFTPQGAGGRPSETEDGRAPVEAANRAADGYARSLARRRRDTLAVLGLVFVGTLMIGFVPGAAVAWVLTLVSGLALAAYVALLVRMRQVAEERDRKLRYLRPPVDPGQDEPFGISGRYAHPSYQMAVAH